MENRKLVKSRLSSSNIMNRKPGIPDRMSPGNLPIENPPFYTWSLPTPFTCGSTQDLRCQSDNDLYARVLTSKHYSEI